MKVRDLKSGQYYTFQSSTDTIWTSKISHIEGDILFDYAARTSRGSVYCHKELKPEQWGEVDEIMEGSLREATEDEIQSLCQGVKDKTGLDLSDIINNSEKYILI